MAKLRIFQVMVIGAFCLQLILVFVPSAFMGDDFLTHKIMGFDGYGAVVEIDYGLARILSIFVLILFGISSFGMLFFQNWARYLYLLLWVYCWVSTMLFGIRVVHPVYGFLGMALGTLDGGIIVLVFISSLRNFFKSKA